MAVWPAPRSAPFVGCAAALRSHGRGWHEYRVWWYRHAGGGLERRVVWFLHAVDASSDNNRVRFSAATRFIFTQMVLDDASGDNNRVRFSAAAGAFILMFCLMRGACFEGLLPSWYEP